MKNLMTDVFFMALALPLLLLSEAAVGIALILTRLWERWRYAARTIREPPPPDGMYGTMARRMERERQKQGGNAGRQRKCVRDRRPRPKRGVIFRVTSACGTAP